MWITLLKHYWSQLLLLVLLLLSLLYLIFTKSSLNNAIIERNQYRNALDYQNATLLEQKAKYDRELSKLPTEIEKITIKYKTRYEYVSNWEGDSNATDCQNADAFLGSFNY